MRLLLVPQPFLFIASVVTQNASSWKLWGWFSVWKHRQEGSGLEALAPLGIKIAQEA
jgi:hypothetical protein